MRFEAAEGSRLRTALQQIEVEKEQLLHEVGALEQAVREEKRQRSDAESRQVVAEEAASEKERLEVAEETLRLRLEAEAEQLRLEAAGRLAAKEAVEAAKAESRLPNATRWPLSARNRLWEGSNSRVLQKCV